MANKKISALTAATTPDGTELVPIVQGGTTKKATITQLTGATVPPTILTPIYLNLAAAGVWPAANRAVFNRTTLRNPGTFRYFRVNIGVQSGNIQCGAVLLSGANHQSYTRVWNSGLIACPAAGVARIDIGATAFVAGDYALFFWADNTTVTVPNAGNAGATPLRLCADVSSIAGGVPGSGTLDWTTGSRLLTVAAEGDV